MLSNDFMLQSANSRLQFWRDQLQAAFRSGDEKRAAECSLLIDEYGLLTAAAIAQFRMSSPPGQTVASVALSAGPR